MFSIFQKATPVFNCSTFCHAAKFGDLSLIKKHFDQKLSPNVRDLEGWTPLICAVSIANNIKLVDFLIENGADVNFPDDEGRTPLMYAASVGLINMMKSLTRNGAMLNLRDSTGMTAIAQACFDGKPQSVKMLVNLNASVHLADIYNHTTLMVACRKGNKETVKLLILANVDVNAIDDDRQSALMIARQAKHNSCVALLIEAGVEEVGDERVEEETVETNIEETKEETKKSKMSIEFLHEMHAKLMLESEAGASKSIFRQSNLAMFFISLLTELDNMKNACINDDDQTQWEELLKRIFKSISKGMKTISLEMDKIYNFHLLCLQNKLTELVEQHE